MARLATGTKKSKRAWVVPLAVDAAIGRAVAMQQDGQDAEAAAIYRRILERTPAHVDALHFLGVAEHRLGRSEQALALLERALALISEHPDLHNNHGNVLKALGRLDEAEAAYGRALTLNPKDARALCNLGAIARERGQLPQAVELFEESIALEPRHYEAHQHLGSAYKRLGRWEDAARAQEQALGLRPKHGDAHFKLGATYYAMGRTEDAAAVYRRWLELDPAHPVPSHLLAGCTGADVPARASDAFVRASFDTFAQHFDRSLAHLQYRAPELVAEAVNAQLGATTGAAEARSLDVLDAGCGTGLCGPALRPRAKRLVGVDLSEGMLERARERGGYDELVRAELTTYCQSAPESYDLIACSDTLVYFGALEEVIGAFRAALRAQGTVVFTTERSAAESAPLGYRIHAHGRYSHSEDYVRAVVARSGLFVTRLAEAPLRREAGQWVQGFVVIATKP
jgi:predicted TPR repeat methyltransferase